MILQKRDKLQDNIKLNNSSFKNTKKIKLCLNILLKCILLHQNFLIIVVEVLLSLMKRSIHLLIIYPKDMNFLMIKKYRIKDCQNL